MLRVVVLVVAILAALAGVAVLFVALHEGLVEGVPSVAAGLLEAVAAAAALCNGLFIAPK